MLSVLLTGSVVSLSGCEKDSSLENAAEEVEEKAEDAGEAVGDAVEEAGDAVEDATDNEM